MANHRESGDRLNNSSRRGFLLTAGSAGLAGLAGCVARGQSSDLSGEIVIDGSDTVFLHTAAVAEEFQWQNNQVRIPIRGSGTGAGFQRFTVGETDLQNASRPITDGERETAEANGIEFLELEVVLDGIALYANPQNDWCDTLTVEELNRIWGSDADATRWSDIDSDWPDEEIVLYGRDSHSGTFDYFTEEINGTAGDVTGDYNKTSDTNVIVRGVRGNEHALGFGGAGYYYENEEDLKLIAVDDDNGGVIPTEETIGKAFEDNPGDDAYTPLSRSMYVYVNVAELTRKTVREFVKFFFHREDPDGPAVTQRVAPRVGSYAIPDSLVDREAERLREAIEEVN
ncbi:PstS family phosphate ABC transporter substrate-binding protein [Natronoarchaeum sp. GCM10025703]|uniref:PstS family phosphate ABC transporter substrate-binding protein n=1 Tax=unclassified Natronoarchaeum TaxID=2620183 RepID=UPI00360A477D